MIAVYLIALNSDDAKRYAVDNFINLLLGMPEDYGLGDAFLEAWRQVASKTLRSAH